jgi:hypothetical protein
MKEFRKAYAAVEGGQPQTPAAGAAEILQAIRRRPRSPISPWWNSGRRTFRPQRVRIVPRFSSGRKATRRRLYRRSSWNIATGVLRQGPLEINLVYRRLGVQEFLLRFDLSHPLVQAYRDRAVCVVNSFRSELAHKKAMFGLLTDERSRQVPGGGAQSHSRARAVDAPGGARARPTRGTDHRPDGVPLAKPRAARPQAQRRLQRPAQLLRLGDGRRRLGARAEASHRAARTWCRSAWTLRVRCSR